MPRYGVVGMSIRAWHLHYAAIDCADMLTIAFVTPPSFAAIRLPFDIQYT